MYIYNLQIETLNHSNHKARVHIYVYSFVYSTPSSRRYIGLGNDCVNCGNEAWIYAIAIAIATDLNKIQVLLLIFCKITYIYSLYFKLKAITTVGKTNQHLPMCVDN